MKIVKRLYVFFFYITLGNGIVMESACFIWNELLVWFVSFKVFVMFNDIQGLLHFYVCVCIAEYDYVYLKNAAF